MKPTTQMKKILIPLIATALQAQAINITLDRIQFTYYLNSTTTIDAVNYMPRVIDNPKLGDPPITLFGYGRLLYSGSPWASGGFALEDSGDLVRMSTDFNLSSIGSSTSETIASALVYFTLNERVEYSLTGHLNPELGWHGMSTTLGSFDGTLTASIGGIANEPIRLLIDETPRYHLSPLAGILEPGQYFWNSHGFSLADSDGWSVAFLDLNRVGVPDAGSTLMLLGIAIGSLCFLRRR